MKSQETRKLRKIKELEEQMGIGIDTFFKALRNGINVKRSAIITAEGPHCSGWYRVKPFYDEWKFAINPVACGTYIAHDYVRIRDCGKTWKVSRRIDLWPSRKQRR